KSRRQPTVVRKPFHGEADGGTVYDASADPSHSVGKIQSGQRLGFASPDPTQTCQHAAEHHEQPGPEGVDQPALKWHKPGFEEHEDGEGYLNQCLIYIELFLQRWHEQRPAVLEVRDCHHTENAEEENYPAVGFAGSRSYRRSRSSHRYTSWVSRQTLRAHFQITSPQLPAILFHRGARPDLTCPRRCLSRRGVGL